VAVWAVAVGALAPSPPGEELVQGGYDPPPLPPASLRHAADVFHRLAADARGLVTTPDPAASRIGVSQLRHFASAALGWHPCADDARAMADEASDEWSGEAGAGEEVALGFHAALRLVVAHAPAASVEGGDGEGRGALLAPVAAAVELLREEAVSTRSSAPWGPAGEVGGLGELLRARGEGFTPAEWAAATASEVEVEPDGAVVAGPSAVASLLEACRGATCG
jgi:hypothetical protein